MHIKNTAYIYKEMIEFNMNTPTYFLIVGLLLLQSYLDNSFTKIQ